jgi:hypothetical protein
VVSGVQALLCSGLELHFASDARDVLIKMTRHIYTMAVCLVLFLFVLYAMNALYMTQSTSSSIYVECATSIVTLYSTWDDDTVVHGTGFIVAKDGYITTAGHIVRKRSGSGPPVICSHVYVTQKGTGRVSVARVVCIDGRADVAILKIDASSDLRPLTIHANYTIQPGDPVVIIGNAFGVDSHSISTGVVRNPRRKDPSVQTLLTSILTSIPTSNGVSGAPILDPKGCVVGIHTSAMHPRVDGTETESDDARFSTLFGGGLSGPILHQIVNRCISLDRGESDRCVSVYRQRNYTLTKKCLPQFTVVPNIIENRLKQGLVLSSALCDNGYIMTRMETSERTGLVVGDILTSINGRTVGQKPADESFGDCTWFLDAGDLIDIVVHRYCPDTHSYTRIQLQHAVDYLPTTLDVPVNDPQFILILSFLAAVVSTAVVYDTFHDNHRNDTDYCTDLTILKPENYGKRYVQLEDPNYNPYIHSRHEFNNTDYYLRRLCPDEILNQTRPDMVYEIMQDMQMSCRYNGKTEYITCPAGFVFNGDTLKQILSIENDGIAWVFHDWLYTSHAFDVRADQTQTQIPRDRRWVVDEVMYEMLKTDGYVRYAWMARRFDAVVDRILYKAWDSSCTTNLDKYRYRVIG